MLTPVQQHALDRFASLLTLADDSLIDAYHQVWEDHRDARRWHAGGRARGKEFIGGAGIGPARVRVADVGRKETALSCGVRSVPGTPRPTNGGGTNDRFPPKNEPALAG